MSPWLDTTLRSLYWNTGRRVVSIEHDHWQCSWLHECHCHRHPFLANLLYMYPAMSALACPIFCFLSSLRRVQSITRLAGREVQYMPDESSPPVLSATQCPVGLQCRHLIQVLHLSRGLSMTILLW